MAIKLSLKSTRHPTVTKQTVPNSQAIGEPQILLGASFASGVSPVLCLGDLRGPWPGDLVCFKR
jgi:xanthine dehydrogenase molybdopterin-binding subunit B